MSLIVLWRKAVFMPRGFACNAAAFPEVPVCHPLTKILHAGSRLIGNAWRSAHNASGRRR